MPVISPNRAYQAARRAGFSASEAAVMVGIAVGESGLNTDATNTNRNGSTDYGLWQINTVHGYPELANGQWRDPDVNAQLAKRVHDKQGRSAWVVWNRGLSAAAQDVVRALGAGALIGATGSRGSPTADPADLNPVSGVEAAAAEVAETGRDISTAIDWLQQRESWERIAKVTVGVGLAFVGAQLLVGRAGKTVVQYVSGALRGPAAAARRVRLSSTTTEAVRGAAS